MWNLIGLGLTLAVAMVAWQRSRAPGSFYEREVYAMTATTHRRYAIASLAFAAFFVAAFGLRWESAGVAGLALYAVIAVFYAASFLRGSAEDDE